MYKDNRFCYLNPMLGLICGDSRYASLCFLLNIKYDNLNTFFRKSSIVYNVEQTIIYTFVS